MRVRRWGEKKGERHGKSVAYYVENGRRAHVEVWKDDESFNATNWNFDGTVSSQRTHDPECH